jgi:RND family efflux transporter MFP subunit
VQQQLNDTIVRAPFSGIVSSRKASVGDVVSSGTELLTIIDPSSMRLEALVPSDDIPRVHPGATVQFTIRGVPGRFEGSVDRFNPWADPTTRQVSIFVSVPNEEGKLIAGLFAQGRVASETRQGVIVPLAAVDETGPVPTVTRIAHDKAERVIIALGPRQTETEQVEVTRGVSAGDVLVIGSAKGITPGTPVKVVK